MEKDWFEVKIDPNGDKYLVQVHDEMDKNHREDDQTMTNQGKMYQVPGTNSITQFSSNK